MPVFDTPAPLTVVLDLSVASVHLTATDRTDTSVEVRPSDPGDRSDDDAAQRVRVDHANGVLRITGPRSPLFDFSRKTRSVQVTIALPTGSSVSGTVQVGDLDGTGALGDCRFTTSAGHVRLDQAGSVRIETSVGHVTVDAVAGDAEVHTSSGHVRLGVVKGAVVVKNSNGATEIDAATGDVRVRAANGDITLRRAGAGVDARTSMGAVRLGEVVRGSVEIETSMGDLDIGIAEGTAARLDVHTAFGKVHNLLDAVARPHESDETVEVHARTSFGAVTVRRSAHTDLSTR